MTLIRLTHLLKCLAKLGLEISGANSIHPSSCWLAWMGVSSFIESAGIAIHSNQFGYYNRTSSNFYYNRTVVISGIWAAVSEVCLNGLWSLQACGVIWSLLSLGIKLWSISIESKNKFDYCKWFLSGDWKPNLFSRANLTISSGAFGQSSDKIFILHSVDCFFTWMKMHPSSCFGCSLLVPYFVLDHLNLQKPPNLKGIRAAEQEGENFVMGVLSDCSPTCTLKSSKTVWTAQPSDPCSLGR